MEGIILTKMKISESFSDLSHTYKKVLVVNPLNTLWSYQMTSEAALSLALEGSRVSWVNLSPFESSKHDLNQKNWINEFRFKNPRKIISGLLESHGIATDEHIVPRVNLRRGDRFKSVAELRNYEELGLNLGAMVFSAIASKYKSTSFSIDEVCSEVNYFMKFARVANKHLEDAIDSFQPDLILTTNDRLIGSSLALQIAKSKKIDSRVVYWGSSSDRYQIYKSSLYDSREWFNHTSTNWEVNHPSITERKELEERISKASSNPSNDSLSFTRGQTKGLGVSFTERTCVFYAQSEYEHSPYLASRISNRFPNQYVAFVQLMEICERLNYKLILKYHPVRNLDARTKDLKSEISDWLDVDIHESVLQLLPDSKIDTYQLIQTSDLNVVWTSTVGIESILRGKKTIVLGDTHWLNLDWGIHAWNGQDLERQLRDPNPALESVDLRPWFWFVSDYGTPFQYSRLENGNLELNGQSVLRHRAWIRSLRKLKELFKGL